MGLRSCRAATVFQPRSSNCLRASAGRSIDALELSGKYSSESDLDRAGQIDGALLHHLLHAGMRRIVGRNTCLHSCALSMVYFSVTFIVATSSLVSVSHSATSSPRAMDLASSSVGRQRDREWARTGLSCWACCSCRRHPASRALPMKPSSGREGADAHHDQVAAFTAGDRDLLHGLCALDFFGSGLTFQQEGFSSGLPCGGTSLLINSP